MKLRVQRMADEIRDILAGCFQGGIMSDPRLGGVTITAVRLSPDFQIATVYFRVYEECQKQEATTGLRSACGFLKKKISDQIKLRRIPELRFFYDESLERGANIEKILHEIKTES